MQAIVLAAGRGTRMRSTRPKVLHEMFGRPLLGYVLETLAALGVSRPIVVIGSGAEQVRSFIRKDCKEAGIPQPVFVLQSEQKGTGHAVMQALPAIRSSHEDVLIWPGDMPLLKRETLQNFIREHGRAKTEVSVLSALQIDPKGYGRILRAGGKFFAIREELDATEAERRIQEVNTGIYLYRAASLRESLRKIRPENRKNEFYLTDTIEVLSQEAKRLEAFPLALAEEAQGINSRRDLGVAIKTMNQREIERHQDRGVTFVGPDQTFVAPGVKIGEDTMVYPWCFIESGVVIGKNCQIGPFAKIRKGTVIGDGSVIGSFVEVVRTHVGKKVLAKHLAYLGDAVVGDETNIGAGTITANFDGVRKHKTRIGRKVLVGSNTVFVAPATIPDRVRTGAGSVVTQRTKIRKGDVVVGVPARAIRKGK